MAKILDNAAAIALIAEIDGLKTLRDALDKECQVVSDRLAALRREEQVVTDRNAQLNAERAELEQKHNALKGEARAARAEYIRFAHNLGIEVPRDKCAEHGVEF